MISVQLDVNRYGKTQTGKDIKGSVFVDESPCKSLPSSALVANAALSLLNLACYLLDRQISVQAESFENEGGFNERMYRVRTNKRKTKDYNSGK